MNTQALMMLDDHEIDYPTLSDEVLAQLALGNELYLATSALTELAERHSTRTVPIAWQIVVTEHGDYYLQKLAVELLFEQVAHSVTRFVRHNHITPADDKLAQYANLVQSAPFTEHFTRPTIQ